MTTLWFLVAISMNADGTSFMPAMPELKASYADCMTQDYYQTEDDRMFCIEADDFPDLIKILLDNFDFGGTPA